MTESKSYYHRGGEIPLLGATIPDHFNNIARRYPERDAIVCRHQNRRLDYATLCREIDHVAKALLANGFATGDRIGVWSTDNIEWLLSQMATARIGAILVNINPANRPRELAYALERSQVQGLFIIPSFSHSNYVDMILELLPELGQQQGRDLSNSALPYMRQVIIFDPADPMATKSPYPGLIDWRKSVV